MAEPPTHCYRAFGLTIHSELELPELFSGEGAPDLEIRLGEVSDGLPNPKATGVRYQTTGRRFTLRVDGHAKYSATDGREIVVQRDGSTAPENLRVFLLNSVMGAILQQRGLLTLHASVVEVDDGAALLAGQSGVGKSTLAAALARRGHRVLCDEIAAIIVRDGRPYVFPAFPQLNIWTDAVEALELDRGALRPVRPDLEKYALPLREGYCNNPLPVARLYVLSTTNTAELKTERLKGVEKVAAVIAQTYRPGFLGDGDWKARHFEQCAAVAGNARILKLTRPQLPFLLPELVDAFERECSR